MRPANTPNFNQDEPERNEPKKTPLYAKIAVGFIIMISIVAALMVAASIFILLGKLLVFVIGL